MKETRVKLGLVGVMHGNMPGDKENGYEAIKTGMKKIAGEYDFDLVVYENPVLSEDDGESARRFMDDHEVDFTMIVHSSLGGGRAFLPLAMVKSYLGIWSIPEPDTKGIMQLNAICGLNMYSGIIGNYLRDWKIPFKWFYGYPESPLFRERLAVTIKAMRAIKYLKGARIGLVGHIADGFENFNFDECVPQKKLGVKIYRRHTTEEIVRMAESVSAAEVEKLEEKICSEGKWNRAEVSTVSMERFARVNLAVEKFVAEHGYDAIALNCWPDFQKLYDVAVCGVLSRMNEAGVPITCEGDVPGLINLMMLNGLAQQPGTIMDLAGIDESDDSILMWHCGPAPKSFADENGVKWDAHFNIGCTCNGKWCGKGVITDLTFKPGEVTISRINNQFDRLLVMSGNAMANKPNFNGSGGWISDLRIKERKMTIPDCINTIIGNRIDHHYELVYGNYENELREMAAWLNISVAEVLPYTPYMQNQI